MIISLIVAASANNAIGKENKLLWNLPEDIKFFKNMTWGLPVVMGRKTFEALRKPLPGRVNIVITSQKGWHYDKVMVAENIEDALAKAFTTNCREIFIIGGGEIYKQSMALADKIYMTRVHASLDGDTFFPIIDESKWMLASNKDCGIDDRHIFDYSFQLWEKRGGEK